MYLHIVSLITIYVLPRFIRGERPQQSTAVTKLSSNGIHQSVSSASAANGAQTNLMGSHQKTKIVLSNDTNANRKKSVQFVDVVPSRSNQCDINVNNGNSKLEADLNVNGDHGAEDSVGNGSAIGGATPEANVNTSINLRDEDLNDYRRQVYADDDNLSMKIRERIDSETRYIEEFIDKTVTGIVELKDDLMRVNKDEIFSTKFEYGNGLANGINEDGNVLRKRNGNEIEQFLRKEINNAVNQVNVLPAVLSNGHAD